MKKHWFLILPLACQLAFPLITEAAPKTLPPEKKVKGSTLEQIKPHEYRWEDPDGFVGRYQSSNGEVKVDVGVNYFKHAFYAKLHTPQTGKRPINLTADNSANPDVLVLSGEGISGKLEKGVLTLSTPKLRNAELKRVTVGKTDFNPPAGATVLLDEKSGLKNFRAFKGGELKWNALPGGVMESVPLTGNAYTKDNYEDCTFYIEYRLPYNSREAGNSGVYMMNAYEVQVIDSFAKDMANNMAASLYKISAPSENVSAPPLEWQSLLIDFTGPRYDAEGTKIANARATVWHNGVKVQDNVQIPHHTVRDTLPEPKGPAPIYLQGHGSYVQYRNAWVLPHNKK